MTKQSKAHSIVVGLALAGVLVMLLATRFGIGVLPDSTVYFDAGRNLANGRGLVVISGTGVELIPLTHYPPLYSTLLALTSPGGATVETSARWLNVILFGGNILLVGISIAFCDRNSFWLPLIGSFLTLTAPDVLAMHAVAMTEPLYLALTFGGLLSLAAYQQNQRRGFLFLAAILIGLAFLARYVGIAAVVTGLVALLFLGRNESGRTSFGFSFRGEIFRRRVVDTLIFAAVSCGPVALWSIRNRLATGGASDRQLAFHPVKFQQIVSAFSTAAQWLLLGKVRVDTRFLAFTIEILVLASLAIYLMRKGRQSKGNSAEGRTKLPHLLIIFMIVYVAVLIFTITFFENDNVLDGRSLLPVHFALLVLIPCVAKALYCRVPKSISVHIAFVVLILLLAGSYTFRGVRWLVRAQADGQGYASRPWKESPTIAQIRKLPSGIPIYSNGVDAICYLTGRRSLDIPAKIIHGTGQPNPRYEAELKKMSDDLRRHNGVLVYFNTLPERWFLPLEGELKSQLPLTGRAITPDGSLFEVSPNSESRRED
ncbi:MAG TPA: hypothetical protein VN920_00650 [Pyrinomonadaceae bacterium]|nr:hypothetical protein [Pyrinomonadaceae bacterium]